MMRLRALRVRNVGCFDHPVALEGLSDGVNVLAGPNELGKSTLLRALKVAIKEKYNTKAELPGFRPYNGGAPRVEVEFETSEGRWLLRKQYLSNPMAELIDLGTSKSLRNNDAQLRLDELLRGPSELERFSMQWVDQGDTLKFIDGKQLGAGVAGLVSDAIESVVVDAGVSAAHGSVKSALEDLQTNLGEKARIKKGGRLQLAQEAVTALEKTHAAARQRSDEQAQRLESLAQLTAKRALLLAADGIAALTAARDTATARLVEATAAQREERDAKQLLGARQSTLQLAQQKSDALVGIDQAITAAAKAIADAEAGLVVQADADSAVKSELQRTEAALARLKTEQAALELALHTARAAEAAVTGSQTRARLTQTLAAVRSAQAEQDTAAIQQRALSAHTPDALRSLKAAVADRDRRDAMFAAIAPEVKITIEAGGAGKMQLNGAALTSDAVLNPDAPLIIDIAGIGRIRIAPHPATASAEAQAARAAAQQRVSAQLTALGVASIDDADGKQAEREAAERQARAAAQRLAILAPDGIERLTAELAAVARFAVHAPAPARPSAAIESDITQLAPQVTAAVHAHARAAEASSKIETQRAAGLAVLVVHSDRLASLMRDRGSDADAKAARDAAAVGFHAAQAAFTQAGLLHRTWDEKCRSQVIGDIETAAASTERKLAEALALQHQINLDIKGLEGALDASSADEGMADETRLAEALDVARRTLGDIEEERAALQLLHQTFEAAANAGRDQIAAPIRARIAPFLALVIPGAELALDTSFAPNALHRVAGTETLDRLSQGTREQIAIVTRLGLGKLLAERNAAVPLILDDALVFADDARIEAMFETLALAARDHQVIIFTCRTKAFASLQAKAGTTTLTLAPWRPVA